MNPPFVFDVHLDLALNAIEWNRDLRLPLEKGHRATGGEGRRLAPGRRRAVPQCAAAETALRSEIVTR